MSRDILPFVLATYIRTREELDTLVKLEYPVGKQMEWKRGKYKGRSCRVIATSWETDSRSLKIVIRVETLSKRPDVISINSNDSFHRRFYSESWFK